jgi:hypothetical protein
MNAKSSHIGLTINRFTGRRKPRSVSGRDSPSGSISHQTPSIVFMQKRLGRSKPIVENPTGFCGLET